VLAAIQGANNGHQVAYGGDDYTAALGTKIREVFGPATEIFPLFNGTGANVVALTSMMPRWGAVICSTSAHINTDEGGAPERVSGLKLHPVAPIQGKLTPELVATQAYGFGDEHRAQPLVVSITQSTEVGTVYTPDEVAAISSYAHGQGMLVHMDGQGFLTQPPASEFPLPISPPTRVSMFSAWGQPKTALWVLKPSWC